MRVWLAVMLMLLAGSAAAADWGHYVNPRFGYAIDLPPGFVGQGESTNGDGQLFKTPTALLAVYGMNMVDVDFETEVRQDQEDAQHDGWNITYQMSTPSAASYSGIKGGRVLYARMIVLCGETLAGFAVEYSRADIPAFDPVIARLLRSLKATDGSVACPTN